MFDLGKFVSNAVQGIRSRQLDDAVDRLNYFITPSILVVFALIIGGKQFFGSPIQCMTPAEFRYNRLATNWDKYVEAYCYIESKYSIPLNEPLLMGQPERRQQIVGYYQWVPFIFLAQALFFFFPNVIWQVLQSRMDQLTIVTEAKKLRSVFGKKREAGAASLTAYIVDCLRARSLRTKESFDYWLGRTNVLSASFSYFLVKMLYLVNVVGQFFLVNKVVGGGYNLWGWQVLNDLRSGRVPIDSGLFPRVTLCDLTKMELGDAKDVTTECLLMGNMMNEKLFLMLWFWFVFVAVCTFVGLLHLFATMIPPYCRERRVRDYLAGVDMTACSPRQLRQFLYAKLGLDGLLLLRFVEQQAGALVARQLAASLWQRYHLPLQYAGNLALGSGSGFGGKVVALDQPDMVKLSKKA